MIYHFPWTRCENENTDILVVKVEKEIHTYMVLVDTQIGINTPAGVFGNIKQNYMCTFFS
jgi:hypothetical protein